MERSFHNQAKWCLWIYNIWSWYSCVTWNEWQWPTHSGILHPDNSFCCIGTPKLQFRRILLALSQSFFCCLCYYWIPGCYFHDWPGECDYQCSLDWDSIRQFSHIWWRLSDDTITWWHVHGKSLWYFEKCSTMEIFPFGVLLVRDTWQEAKTGSNIRYRRLGRLVYLFLWDKIVKLKSPLSLSPSVVQTVLTVKMNPVILIFICIILIHCLNMIA